MGAETRFSGDFTFKFSLLLLQLAFEPMRFEPPTGFSVFLLRNSHQVTDFPEICTEIVLMSSEFQVSTFRRFEVVAISAACCRKTMNFAQKKVIKILFALL